MGIECIDSDRGEPDKSDPKTGLLLNIFEVRGGKFDLVVVHVRGTTPSDAVRFVKALIAELDIN